MNSRFQTIISNLVRFWFPQDEILENHRPVWMNGLELDIYVPRYWFAVEVNGIQHYQQTFSGHSLAGQKQRDLEKREICKRRNIYLHIVREFHHRGRPAREISRQLRSSVKDVLKISMRDVPVPPQALVHPIHHHMQVLKRLSERNGIISTQ